MQPILEVAIGLVFVIAVTSAIVSGTMELFSAARGLRARTLELGIARMLDGQDRGVISASVLKHPLITSLAKADKKRPSYIDGVTFAATLLDTAVADVSRLLKVLPDKAGIDQRLTSLADDPLAEDVRHRWKDAKSDPASLVAGLVHEGNSGTDLLALLLDDAAVDARITALESAKDPDAPTLRTAYQEAKPGPTFTARVLVERLSTPRLIERAQEGTANVTAALDEVTNASPHVGRILNQLWNSAGHEVDSFRHGIEDWFDREMERVSGWYARQTQAIMLCVAVVIAVSLNISGVTVARVLWNDPTLRQVAVATATQSSTQSSTSSGTTASATTPENQPTYTDLKNSSFPVGWTSTAWPGWEWYLVLHLLGIVLVAVATSLGAPFWFNVLNKLTNFRTTGPPPAPAAAQRT